MKVSRPALTCYRCGHHYDYLGVHPHPGRCPDCDSRAVTPAPPLVVDECLACDDQHPETVHVHATDATDRTFRFSFDSTGEREVSIHRVLVTNVLIRSPDGTWPDSLVTDSIREKLRETGYTLAPAP